MASFNKTAFKRGFDEISTFHPIRRFLCTMAIERETHMRDRALKRYRYHRAEVERLKRKIGKYDG